MNRPWQIWTVFGLGLALMFGAMGWVSVELVTARREAILEENVRLALWRMESTLAPLVAQESGRPYFEYTSFYPAERAYTNMFAPIGPGEVRLPSPLLEFESPLVKLHFNLGPGGELASPEVPTGNMRDLAEQGYAKPERIERDAAMLDQLRRIVQPATLAAALPLGPPGAALPPVAANQPQGQQLSQAARNLSEYQVRSRRYQEAANSQMLANPEPPTLLGDVTEGTMTALWADGALLLARRVRAGGAEYIQGAWLDWPAVRQWLLSETRDLLPGAGLAPCAAGDGHESRRLASLPVRLVPGDLPAGFSEGWSPVLAVLIAAWICVLVASGAVAALLLGTVSLSERRAAFVSAVTHEMRTPLTTFLLYTEMLGEDMVAGEDKRRRYLATLRAEAQRLAHLVENVLGYARLEQGRPAGRLETVRLGDLVDGAAERLRTRAAQAGMDLLLDLPEAVRPQAVKADPSAVEQVLLNLVDNACKYAAGAEDRRIHLEAGRAGGRIALSVRDHGPGVARDVWGRLFRPFSKSAQDAANSAPGVGLGLALSRRLARGMGGDLRLAASGAGGASFVLVLAPA